MKKAALWSLIALLCLSLLAEDAEAKRKKRSRRRRYTGPPPTHPVVLWSRTLSESTDREQRKIAAFKLSQYSQTIYQESIVSNLIRCMKDSDVQIKVLCTKAMARAGTKSQAEGVRKALLERYQADGELKNTIARTFTARVDNHPSVHDTFLETAKGSADEEELLALLGYFEINGTGGEKFVETLAGIHTKHASVKVKRAVAKALGDRAEGQGTVVELLSGCAQDKDTPLALTCLSGLQAQARKDPRAWEAIQKTIMSGDPDMLMATLDVINVLPETPKKEISARLVEILDGMDDAEIQEKAVLALGVCGDHSETIVNMLVKVFEAKDTDESVRVAAAMMLGKQADAFPEKPKSILSKCMTEGKTQSLKLACELGLKELESRKSVAAQAALTPSPAPRTPTESPEPSSEAASAVPEE